MAKLGLHANHLKRLEEFQTAQGQQFEQLIELILKHTDFILTTEDIDYPTQLMPYQIIHRLYLVKVITSITTTANCNGWGAENLVHMDDKWLMILLII
jgi:hypothetical protein